MWEETGLVVELVRVLGVYGGPEFRVTYPNGDKTSYVTVVFEARPVGGKLEPVDDESSDVGYFSLSEMLKLNAQPWMRAVFPRILDDRQNASFDPASWKPEDASE